MMLLLEEGVRLGSLAPSPSLPIIAVLAVQRLMPYKPFRLTDAFLKKYQAIEPPFGFNGLGELVYLRTYSRVRDDGQNEVWWETVKRVVEGCYSMQKRHIMAHQLGWNDQKAQRSAQEMYDRIFHMKFLPPGRGLWAMGSPLTEERGLFASLLNCAFCSTEDIAETLEQPFAFLMDASMLGIGVGFDTKGAGSLTVKGFHLEKTDYRVIPDTREGWVESVGLLIRNGFTGGHGLEFDYGHIRPAGQPINGFGGVASGPEPLKQLHERIVGVIRRNQGQPITIRTIVDIMNMIGACVVAGNVRRTAEISFGDPASEEYRNLKNYHWNGDRYEGPAADRAEWGWASNNSVMCPIGMDYTDTGTATAMNGEPGYAWLDNMQAYGRLGDVPDWKDKRAKGANPCAEQTLESYECCCLVETFPAKHESLDDYKRTLKCAYLYAKTVTLGTTPWERTNRVQLRNRRIGCSQSGIQQFIARYGIEQYRQWCLEGYDTIQYYDRVYSEWFCVPQSVKTTSIKPSGTVSLLAGATPGMHWPENLYYIRRMRLAKNSELVPILKKAGYHLEPCVGQEDSTVVVNIPVALDEPGLRPLRDVSMWEQLAMAAFIQCYWADNQVSCTVTFNPETEGPHIPAALNYYQYQLKGISLLPALPAGAYAQMPYEAIGEETYHSMRKRLKPLHFHRIGGEQAELEPGCESGVCLLPTSQP